MNGLAPVEETPMRTLVFVHGRNQQGRSPDELRRRWASGLNEGLTAAGRSPLDSAAIEEIRFPFYADVLYTEEIQGRAAVPNVATLDALGWVDPGLPPEVNAQQVAMLQAMAAELGYEGPATLEARALGVPDGPWFRGMLAWVANHSGVDEAVIRGYLRDVSVYLEMPGCRSAVQDVVRPVLLAAEGFVLVGHSLGGVVSAELLAEEEVRARVELFVAVGAPLGLDAVTNHMQPRDSASPSSPWVNVFDPRDWVPLGSPLPTTPWLRKQLHVANPRGYEHSIEQYLSHPEVADVVVGGLAAAQKRASP
jgi:hypothetical protein